MEACIANPDSCWLAVNDQLEGWLPPCDVQRFNDMLRLGFHYSELKTYAERDSWGTQLPSRHYRRALCAGLTELLQVYQGAVLAIQKEVLEVSRTVRFVSIVVNLQMTECHCKYAVLPCVYLYMLCSAATPDCTPILTLFPLPAPGRGAQPAPAAVLHR